MLHQSIKVLALSLALLATPAAAQQVYVQRGPWNTIIGYAANPQPGNAAFDATPTPLTDSALSAWIAARGAVQAAQSQLASTLASGIVVTSTSTAALNATYATDQAAQDGLSAIATGIANGLGLPGGGSTMLYADITGTVHTFTQSQILALAKAARDFVYAAKIASLGQGGWPTTTATIP